MLDKNISYLDMNCDFVKVETQNES